MTGLPILTYHALDHSGRVIATRPEWFRETLSRIHGEGFRCVSLAEWIADGRPRIDRGFAIAFDDGLSSIHLAADSLQRFGFRATVFLVSGRMGRSSDWDGPGSTDRVVDWSELADLRGAGFEFGAHTVSHPRLSRCDDATIARQIVDSRREIEDRTGEACPLFAYPYGDVPRFTRELVGEHFAAGFTTRLGYGSDREHKSAVSRVDSFYLQSPRRLRALLSGRCGVELCALRAARAARRGIAVVGSAFREYPHRAARVAAGGA